MSHEQRVLIAVIVSVIFCGWWANRLAHKQQTWLEQQKKAQPPENKVVPVNVPEKEKGKDGEKKQADPQPQAPQPQPELAPKPPVEAAPQPSKAGADKEETVEVQTNKYYMKWTSKGAALQFLKMKEFYHNDANKKEQGWQQKKENWLEVIPELSPTHSLVLFGKAEGTADTTLENAFWSIEDREENLKKSPPQIVFSLQTPTAKYVKHVSFPLDGYYFNARVEVHNLGTQNQEHSLEIGGGAGILCEDSSIVHHQAYLAHVNPDQHAVYEIFTYPDILKAELNKKRPYSWVALLDKYFAHVLEVENPAAMDSVGKRAFLPDYSWTTKKMAQEKLDSGDFEKIRKQYQQLALTLKTKPIVVAPKGKADLKFEFHVDSKERLSTIKMAYRKLDDYGFFAPISYLLLWILDFFYKIFTNYGVAIICLTLAIKFALYPLSRKQQVSMQNYQKKMKVFQPEMRVLQEKYKDNRAKFQEEVMKLYKKHDVSVFPLGGCLPIFLQLPVFIGLYSAILYSIKLRQASFLWIADLSQPDRLAFIPSSFPLIGGNYLNLLPILMTIVWVIQMKTAPTPEDPQMKQQQQIMIIMPLIFFFLFYGMASGLVLYWFVMQLISILEQLWIKKTAA